MKTAACILLLVISTPLFSQVKYVNTSFENASQLDWQIDSTTGAVHIGLIYDRERNSVNRANGHWHFQLQAERGSDVTVILKNFENIWNGMDVFKNLGTSLSWVACSNAYANRKISASL